MRALMPLAVILIAGGLAGLMLPLEEDARPAAAKSPPPDEPAQDATPQVAVAQPASGWMQEVVLQRQKDGHFYADVGSGQNRHRMLVDTGASLVALTAADAFEMGIYWDDADIAPVAQGAGGPVEGVNVTIDRLQLGGFEAYDIPAMVIPDGLHISLLGQSFLSQMRRVEIAGDRMILSN